MPGCRFFEIALDGTNVATLIYEVRCCQLPGSSRQPYRCFRIRLWEPAQGNPRSRELGCVSLDSDPSALFHNCAFPRPTSSILSNNITKVFPPHTYYLTPNTDPQHVTPKRLHYRYFEVNPGQFQETLTLSVLGASLDKNGFLSEGRCRNLEI